MSLAPLVGLSMLSGEARAEVTVHTDANVCGFLPDDTSCPGVTDSATDGFHQAIGDDPLEIISFTHDRFGNSFAELLAPALDGAVDGSSFSDELVFTSPDVEPTGFVDLVLDDEGRARMGPAAFGGELVISLDRYTTALGLGLVGFGSSNVISLYDPEGDLIDSYDGVSDNTYTFIGFTTDSGERIGRVVLNGDFYALQDLQFVPEPASALQATAAMAALAALRASRRRT
jgi:hypothetical protein